MSGNPGTSGPTPHFIPSHVADVHSKALRKHIDRKRRYQKPRVVFSLKCNRQYPCDNCIKRNQGPVCHYDTERANLSNSTKDLHDRLRFLEEKVQRLERQSTPDADSGGRNSVSDVRERSSHVPGVIFSGHGGTQYVNSGHWSAILSEIEGIGKNGGHAAVANPIDDVERRNRGPELLLGMSASTDIRVLLNAMPSRNIADALVAQYFKSGETSLIFIHTPTFYKEYEQFWADSLHVSIPWLAIFCNYSIPGRYKPEAFVMYLGNEYLQNPTAKSGTRVLPPAGPETENTPIAKTLSVERVLTVASEILQATSSMEPLSYDKTIELNAKIDEVRSRLSPAFQMQLPSLSTSGINTEGVREVDIALQRCGTEMAIQVARCILHRQYLLRARSETRYDQFRWACLDAARQILHYQQELFQHVLVRAKQHNMVLWDFEMQQLNNSTMSGFCVT
ncbi:hypothetical protein N8T08_007843 [Aspergillus melleus]|uniref:Uncharacterized protein n=1 Tax=Aspergillus melleus TaxID=138277 RepID=A0ACC3AX71_9EURO|nr:hypothetical protein N8T08_007843 [Aspergillus melleus]